MAHKMNAQDGTSSLSSGERYITLREQIMLIARPVTVINEGATKRGTNRARLHQNL